MSCAVQAVASKLHVSSCFLASRHLTRRAAKLPPLWKPLKFRPARVVVAGFSQGGAIALQTALRYGERLAGVLALSTYLPLASTLATERSSANHGVPIFMAHGRYDDLIPLDRAERSRDVLTGLGYRVEWHEYPMPHSVCAAEIADIAKFLTGIL